MAVIGDLVVDLRANTARFEREMRKAETITGRLNARVKLADRSFVSLQRRLGGVKSAVGALVGSGGMALLVKRSVETADAIGKTADKLGVSTTALQVYRFQAERTGVTQQALEMGLQRLGRRLGQIAQFGKSEASPALKQLGVEALDAAGNARKLEDIIPEISDKLAQMTNRQEQLAIMQKLVDSEGVALINTWGKGSAALKSMEEQAKSTGNVMREDVIRRAEQAADRLGVLEGAIQNKVTAAFVDLAPELETFTGYMLDGVEHVLTFANAIGFMAGQLGLAEVNTAGLTRAQVDLQLEMARENLAAASARQAAAASVANNPLIKFSPGLAPAAHAANKLATAQVDTLAASVKALEKRQLELIIAEKKGIPVVEELTDAQREAQRAAIEKAAADRAAALRLEEQQEAAAKAAESYQKYTAGLRNQNRVLALSAKGLDKQIPLLQAQIRAREILGRDLLPTETAELEKLIQKQNELNDAIEQQAEARIAAEQAAANARDAAEKAAEEAQRPFRQASENIQTAFGDMFTDIFRDGTDGFKSFGNTIKDIFARLAGEIAAMMVIRPVLSGIGLSGFAGAASASPLGGFGSLGGGGGLGNIGSLFATGRNFLTGGLNGIADSALNPFGMAGGFLQDAFGVNALTTGLGQAISLGGPLALLGGALGGSTGAGIGGGFGAGFSVGGPIGGAIGAVLGGLGGSLFGSKPSPPKFHVYGGANPRSPITDNDGWARSVEGFGALGSLQFAGQHLGDNNSILDHQPFIDAVIAMDNQIAGLLGDRALAVAKQAAQSFNVRSKGSISIDSVIRDRQARIGAAIGRAGGNQSLAAALQAPTSLEQLSDDIGLISMLGSSFDGMTQTAGLLAQGMQAVDDKFDALATRARQLSLPLDRLNDLREAEKRQLEQTLGLGGVRDLLNSLTATSASPLDQATQLQNANRLYRDAISAAGAGDQLALNQLPGVANNLLGLLRSRYSHGANFFGGIDFNAPNLPLLNRDSGLDVVGFDQIRADLERLLGIPGFSDGGITTGLSFAHAGEAVIPLDTNRAVPVTLNTDMVAPVVQEMQISNDIAAANGDEQTALLQQVAVLLSENNRLLRQQGATMAVAR